MEKLIIEGGRALNGEVKISKSKNSCLPIMAAVLLAPKKAILNCLPDLRDIRTLEKVLAELGVKITKEGEATHFDTSNITSTEADYELVKTMRASILVLGPLLTRFGEAKVSLPGGCAIGSRPIDIHLDGLKKMGAEIELEAGYVRAKAKKLKGAKIVLPFPSVGATENLMMAAAMADGETIIENAAREPEIDDLAECIEALGAEVSGSGTSVIKIVGKPELKDIDYTPIPDRIETATYLIGALMTKGDIHIKDCRPAHIDSVIETLRKMGAKIDCTDTEIKVYGKGAKLIGTDIDTAPYPGFPTDVQAQLMALTTIVEGASVVSEHIFENRFMHVPELNRMGANIKLHGSSAMVKGVEGLKGAPVMCTDLRASAALVLAALTATGESEVRRVYHIDRGYEKLDEKLRGLGPKSLELIE